jgi:CheY-like chemotaxis protein
LFIWLGAPLPTDQQQVRKVYTITLIILIQTTEWYQRQGKISCYTTYLTFNVKYDDGAIIPSEIIDTAESLGCGRWKGYNRRYQASFESHDSNLKVDTYNNPLLALQKFKMGIYDFILLDIRMTPIDGIELYKRIRDIDKDVEVFILTATDYTFDEFRKICSSYEEKYFIHNQFHCRSYAFCKICGDVVVSVRLAISYHLHSLYASL